MRLIHDYGNSLKLFLSFKVLPLSRTVFGERTIVTRLVTNIEYVRFNSPKYPI